MLTINGLPVEIVILRCPYMNLQHPETRDLFSKMMHLKYLGYGNRHNLGSLPLDTTDYIADHPLICVREKSGELIPISGSKVMTYETCKFFNLEFAMESCFKKGNKPEHLDKLYHIIDEAHNKDRVIAYHGGYTIDPRFGTNPEEREKIRNLFMGITMLYFQENQIAELLGLGVPVFKTEHFFYQWGYERCTANNQELSPFPLHFLPGVDGVMMHLKEYSEDILKLSDGYKFVWNRKIELGERAPGQLTKKAAA
nr:hypothetical protein BHI3_18840 [Bacteriovorax sp. HI3]